MAEMIEVLIETLIEVGKNGGIFKRHAGKHCVLTRKEKIMSKAEGYLIRHPLLGESGRHSKLVPFDSIMR